MLNDVVAPSQTTFLPDRQISDAILIAQELMHNYHLQSGPPRCAIKVGLQKAFDTVSWQFIIAGLKSIGLSIGMINWIQTCISTTHYSVSVSACLFTRCKLCFVENAVCTSLSVFGFNLKLKSISGSHEKG